MKYILVLILAGFALTSDITEIFKLNYLDDINYVNNTEIILGEIPQKT